MFDKEDVAIAYLKLGAIGDFHGFAVDGTAEHLHRVSGTGVSLEGIFDMKRHVADDMTLRAFPDPLRAHVSDAALENDLRLTDKLIERGRDDGSGAQGAESENGDGN